MIHLFRIVVACLIASAPIYAAETYELDIESQQLSAALRQFAKQSGLQVVYYGKVAEGINAEGVKGRLTAEEALAKLLAGTGLRFEALDRDTVAISEDVQRKEISGILSTDDRVRLSEAPAAAVSAAEQDTGQGRDAAEDSADTKLEEIIVTASRREQSAQDFSGGLQVFSGAELDRAGANGFEAYLLSVPAVSFRDQGAGSKRIALRGVSNFAGSDNGITAPSSTVGLYLNDISIVDTSNVPDIATYDLNRIEVLRGPQGTLYGEGTMGGAIKMVLNSPDPAKFEAKADTTVSNTQGGGFNYRVRGAANLPVLVDRIALRFTGTYQNQDGFVDNVANGQDDINGEESFSLRGGLFVQITDRFTAEALAIHSVQNQDQFNQVDKTLGDLQINSVEPLFNEARNNVFGLTLNLDLGPANLTSISSYYSTERHQLIRVPVLITPVFGTFGTVTQDPIAFDVDLHSVAQELRLVSKGDRRLDWVLGAFYRDKKQDGFGNIFVTQLDLPSVNAGLSAAALPLIPSDGSVLRNITTDSYEQFAAYGEINFSLLESLELIAGLRWFHEKVGIDNTLVAASLIAAASGTDVYDFTESGTVPKFGLSYRMARDKLLYAQAAKGFRAGIININRAFGVGDASAESDNLWNYEVGAKTAWFDGRVKVNSALFFIDWKNVQTFQSEISPISNSLTGYFGNGGDAQIRGVEVDLTAAPNKNILFGATVGYTSSELTRATGDLVEGALLPNTPKWTGSAFAEYRKPVSPRFGGYLRLDVQYSDEQATRSVAASNDGSFVDSYALGNMTLGLEADSWGLALFVNNLWDERAEFGRGVTGAGPIFNLERYTIARPRTYGLTFSVTY